MNIRIGNGFDVHKFSPDRKLILGGVHIEYPQGLLGHSDADVLVHAIIDSLLGAASLADIGQLFPDNAPKYKDISSLKLLQEVNNLLLNMSIQIINIDTVVVCQSPKIFPYIDEMKKNISDSLNGLEIERIGIKGKTTEELGFTGRGEGIAVMASSLVLLGG
jgi:2-C-methyl-D-erythritol 2,4-cyclodiphosphate synthase